MEQVKTDIEEPTKVYGYLRVSGKGQVQGTGFDRQQESIMAFCAGSGYAIERIFREQVSGTKGGADRPQFKEMVSAILKNGVDTVVVESMDRLARQLQVQESLIIYLASKDINLISANTGENITKAIASDPMKKALIQIQGVFAELDKSLTVKKLKKARQKVKADQGKCEGRKGYKDSSETNRGIVAEIMRLRRKRKGMVRLTYQKVADTLNEQGKTTMDGLAFTAKNVAAIMYRHKGRWANARG